MNKVILMGNITRDPMIRYSEGSEPICVARYTLAVDRRTGKSGGQQAADYIQCVAFGKKGEFAEKYLRQGMKIAITGRIQTGSYTDRDGRKVYTTEVIVDEHEFAESKANSEQRQQEQRENGGCEDAGDGFMNIPDGIDEELPFS